MSVCDVMWYYVGLTDPLELYTSAWPLGGLSWSLLGWLARHIIETPGVIYLCLAFGGSGEAIKLNVSRNGHRIKGFGKADASEPRPNPVLIYPLTTQTGL